MLGSEPVDSGNTRPRETPARAAKGVFAQPLPQPQATQLALTQVTPFCLRTGRGKEDVISHLGQQLSHSRTEHLSELRGPHSRT